MVRCPNSIIIFITKRKTMEIKDILSELITVSTNLFNEKGQPDNFDLEDFISELENHFEELDEIGVFHFENDNDSYDFGDEEY